MALDRNVYLKMSLEEAAALIKILNWTTEKTPEDAIPEDDDFEIAERVTERLQHAHFCTKKAAEREEYFRKNGRNPRRRTNVVESTHNSNLPVVEQ